MSTLEGVTWTLSRFSVSVLIFVSVFLTSDWNFSSSLARSCWAAFRFSSALSLSLDSFLLRSNALVAFEMRELDFLPKKAEIAPSLLKDTPLYKRGG